MKRKEVPKKVKPTPRAPLVLIWDTMRVVTVELSTSAWGTSRELAWAGCPCTSAPRRPGTEAGRGLGAQGGGVAGRPT